MLARIINRRTLATAAISVVAGTGSIAGVSLAQGSGGARGGSDVVRPAGILGGVNAILARLVANSTISQQQADAVQAQANDGSIDPKTLVQQGVVTDSQMRTIADQIDQLKLAGN